MTVFTEGFHAGEHLVSEANGNRSREVVTITGADLAPGTVLGKITTGGAVTVGSATFAGTGDGTLTKATPAYGTGVMVGDYKAVCVEKTTDSGLFEVVRPDGTVDGVATVGTAYDGQVKFTIADGTTDFAQGATFTIPVSIASPAGVGKYKQFNQDATDGSQHAAAVLFDTARAASADVAATAHVRDCEVNGLSITWPADITDNEKAAATAELAALGIIVRN